MFRILFSREMSCSAQQAFQTWASEQYEWGEREHDARVRDRKPAILPPANDDTATVTVSHRRAA